MKNSPAAKRKQTILRIVSYVAMTISVVVISLICILLILGYRFDSQNGTIEQGGLIQFRSFPSGASIELDSKQLSFKTPGKLNVEVGAHSTVMRLSGYQEWRKKSTIKAGELRWLNYARLIPTNITSTTVASHPTVADTLPAPDRQWYALLEDAAIPIITLYDLRDPEIPKASKLTLPLDSYTSVEGQAHVFSIEEWDFGSRYLIVRHQIGETIEYLKVDRTAVSETVNITRTFNLPFSDIHFSGTSGNVFYGQNITDLRKIDLAAKSVSQPLVTDVDTFELYKSNTIAYTATRGDKKVVGVYIDDKETVVRTYGVSALLFIDISSYFDTDYLAIGSANQVEIIKDPLENADSAGRSFATLSTQSSVGWIGFASSGRFLVAGNGTKYSTYDVETDESFSSQFDGVSNASQSIEWLDDFYLYSDASGSLKISEFDGTNRHNIVVVAPGFMSTLSDDGKYLYSIGKTGNRFSFQSSKMTNN